MLIIKLYVNKKRIGQREALNVSEHRGLIYGKGKQIYSVIETIGKKRFLRKDIEHKFEDGAWRLTEKICKLKPYETRNNVKLHAGRRHNSLWSL